MIVKYLNIDDKEISTFAFIICEENGILYTPVYNTKSRIAYFTDVTIKNTSLVEVYDKYDLNVGDKRIYAYYCNYTSFLGNKNKLKDILLTLLTDNKIRTPFSMLEVIQFLKIKGKRKAIVLEKCHEFLSDSIEADSLVIWEESVQYKKKPYKNKKTDTIKIIDPERAYYDVRPKTISIMRDIVNNFSLNNSKREEAAEYGN